MSKLGPVRGQSAARRAPAFAATVSLVRLS